MNVPADKPTAEPTGAMRTVAVIDIGTAAVRLAIAEISPGGKVRTLESLSQAVNLGRDSFTRGAITRGSTEDCVQVLRTYRKILHEYQIDRPEQVRVIATSAVREAANRLQFLDRIYIGSGFQIEPLDEAEVNRITYLSIQPLVDAHNRVATENRRLTGTIDQALTAVTGVNRPVDCGFLAGSTWGAYGGLPTRT
jgi:exopolyphosphatase/guanosine-5'-triphosphate,3'-diphosphate pyrophosphatase